MTRPRSSGPRPTLRGVNAPRSPQRWRPGSEPRTSQPRQPSRQRELVWVHSCRSLFVHGLTQRKVCQKPAGRSSGIKTPDPSKSTWPAMWCGSGFWASVNSRFRTIRGKSPCCKSAPCSLHVLLTWVNKTSLSTGSAFPRRGLFIVCALPAFAIGRVMDL